MKPSTILLTILLVCAFCIPSSAEESWSYITNNNHVNSQYLYGNDLWLATSGCVVKYDISNGAIKKFTR